MFEFLAPRIIWDPPSLLYSLLTQPVKTLIRLLDYLFSLLRPAPLRHSRPLRVVCISDSHCLIDPNIPDGDLLVHAGDLANLGDLKEVQDQVDWLASLPHEHKVVIAGNHDRFLDPRSRKALSEKDRNGQLDWKGLRYLQHTSTTLKFNNGRELTIYGAPQTPTDEPDDHAFRYPRGADAWSDTIPPGVDILVTHSPPKYHLDLPISMGDEHLLAETWRVKPRLHVFGHVHAAKTEFVGWLRGGKHVVTWDQRQRCLELALSRPDGLLIGLIHPRSWIDVARVLYYGTVGLLRDYIIGGGSKRSTQMVLSSLVYCNTGRLGNPAQVVEI